MLTRLQADTLKNVDGYIMLEEAASGFNWRNGLVQYVKICNEIRVKAGDNALCSGSGGEWGRKVEELLQMDPPFPNFLVNIDPYSGGSGDVALQHIEGLRARGWVPILSEIGVGPMNDTREDVERRIAFAKANRIPFYIFALDSRQWNGGSRLKFTFSFK